MKELSIAPNANWFVPSICQCTPDNELIYVALTKIVCIAPKERKSESKTIDAKKR